MQGTKSHLDKTTDFFWTSTCNTDRDEVSVSAKPFSARKSRPNLSAVSTSFARIWLIFQTIAKSVCGNTQNRGTEELTPQQQLSKAST